MYPCLGATVYLITKQHFSIQSQCVLVLTVHFEENQNALVNLQQYVLVNNTAIQIRVVLLKPYLFTQNYLVSYNCVSVQTPFRFV